MSQSVYFLDANIFMYAAGTAHSYKDPCVRILAEVEAGHLLAVINTEIVQEILYRYAHIGLADKGLQLSREVLRYPIEVLSVNVADIRLAIEFLELDLSSGVQTRDAIHVATMKRHKIDQILSTDRHFDLLDIVKRHDPLDFVSILERDIQ
jgi:predicted nucleic acid-binding protein